MAKVRFLNDKVEKKNSTGGHDYVPVNGTGVGVGKACTCFK